MGGTKSLRVLTNKAGVYLKRNAPTILTCVSAAGVIATTVFTAKATIKAVDIVKNMKDEEAEPTKIEIIKAVAPTYIPTAITLCVTVTALFGANGLNKKRQASLVGAYGLLATSFKDYKSKVEELYGEGTNANVRAELVKDHLETAVIEIKEDKQLFYDMFSERYFESTMAEVIHAEYMINRDTVVHSGVPLNAFYGMLDVEEKVEYEELGWAASAVYDMCWHQWIDFKHDIVTTDDGLEVCVITMDPEPIPDYLDY